MNKNARTLERRSKSVARGAAQLWPNQLVPGLAAGLVIGVIDITLAASFAALIFAGELSDFVSNGIGLMLFGAAVVSAVVAMLSSHKGMVGSTPGAPAAILSIIAAAIVVTMPAEATSEETFLTVVAAIALSSLLTGIFFLILGYLRLGGLVRFLPYPVVGGFLAGTGWLLTTGSIAVMTDVSVGSVPLVMFFQPEILLRWLPGLIFAVTILLILSRYRHVLILPATILGAAAIFYAALWFSGASVSELGAEGWLLGPIPKTGLYQPLTPSVLDQVNWSVILGQAANVATLLIIVVVGVLLNSSSLELVVKKDIDLDLELRAAGIANLASGLGSSMPGHQLIALSTLGHLGGASSRLTGVTAAAILGAALVAGATVFSFFPKVILGGLLMYLGLSFLIQWVYQAYFKLPKLDYFIVILILVVIAIVGFLQGVTIGILAAVVFFVYNYSRTDVIKHVLSGANFESRVTRGVQERRLLREMGEQLYILQLQGFIFFGTADNLLQQVRQRVSEPDLTPLRFILLGFSRVTGLDSTAIISFNKMKQLAEVEEIVLVLTDLSPEIQLQFENGDFKVEEDGIVRFFPDLDHGLEWCENQILRVSAGEESGRLTFQAQLAELLPEAANVPAVLAYLDRQEIGAGHYLIRQGDPPDYLYFVEAGQVTAQLEFPDREAIRLETMKGGHVFGEIGFYLGQARTASVITDEPSTIYCLSRRVLERMQTMDPDSALAYDELIIRLLAERVSHLVVTVDAFQR